MKTTYLVYKQVNGVRQLVVATPAEWDANLPKVVFHSLRHTSTTYKLKLSGGDIKAVQGDTGHAQATMVMERYAHICARITRIAIRH